MRRTRLGIDNLLADPGPVAGKRFGLITNPSGVTSEGVPAWRALSAIPGAKLVRLFGPEHGVDGGAIYMEAVGNAVHPPTGLPSVSLYGSTRESLQPRREDLEDLDALVFDVADVGARYYTYIWTMMLAMEACARSRVRFIVCDRPNPIGGQAEGAPQEEGYLSFVGMHPIPVRHGMTAGEMARLLAEEKRLDVDLAVSPVTGWARDTNLSKTGLPWVSPSPNIPTPATALVYPGMCLLEGTNLSEARGTTRPFEMFGAPWLPAERFADALSALELPGVSFVPVHFRPMFDKHAGETCGGAMMSVTDRRVFCSLEAGMRVVGTARRLDPERFAWRTEPYEFDPRPAIDLLTGSPRYRELVDRGDDLAAEIARHDAGARAFLPRREPHLSYPDRKPAAVAFVGGHESGKTTLIVELVPWLKAMGLTVGTVKHTSKDAEDDVPGKDSHRHANSGASVSAFVTPERTTARRFGPEADIEELLAREFSDCDLVLVEGFKSLPVPKIEVTRERASRPRIEGVLARVSDRPAEDSVPTHAFADVQSIVATVLRLAGLDRGRKSKA
ncbi:MAG TPA: molybdopterin-guanine dinucleotide biosynthesis protein B [Thermoanaerobaculia bacterium]|nr:molybdopterin-guanine dinucleotide biosynthesis protein B [Thermoanaerobaculia bacterium]